MGTKFLILSRSGSVKKFEFLRPFSKAAAKCFALDQLYIELKTKSLFTTTSNVLPSNVDNFLPDLDINPSIVY